MGVLADQRNIGSITGTQRHPNVDVVATADGARIAVKRRPVAGGVPVVMLHGIAANADQWDLPEATTADFRSRSFAACLQEAGFDLWMMNFRGSGWPAMSSAPPAHQRDWNVDDE